MDREIIGECQCINPIDKHELSKAIVARIELYRKSISEIETEEIIEKAITLKKGEIEIKHSPETAKAISQYKEIINRLEGVYNRLENTPKCKLK